MPSIRISEKSRFFIKNMLRGLAWLAVIILFFAIARRYINPDFMQYLQPFFENTLLILGIYSISEIFFGIIPPELFMIWAMRNGNGTEYIFFVTIFTVISYLAGIIGFLTGKYLSSTRYYRYLRRRFLGRYHSLLHKYGFFLILVAALTPLPYSGISTLVGSLNYPVKKYLLFALSRFLRFALYAFIIWQTGII